MGIHDKLKSSHETTQKTLGKWKCMDAFFPVTRITVYSLGDIL